MAIIMTDDKHYTAIVDAVNKKTGEVKQNLPEEIAPRIEAIPETKDKSYGREAPTLEFDKTEILLTPQSPSDTITVTTNSDGALSVNNPIPGSMSISVAGKIVTFTKGAKSGTGNTVIELNKTDVYRRGVSPKISLEYYDPFPHATGSPIEKTMMDEHLKTLTGSITFSRDPAPESAITPLNSDGTVLAEVTETDATIYSKDGGGVFAPETSALLFVADSNAGNGGYPATTLDVSGLDTSKVTMMGGMFGGTQATTLDLSSFSTSKVTFMDKMFLGAQATTLDLSSFDTSKVTSMATMFYMSKAKTLDLSSFDTSEVVNMSNIFAESAASTIYCRTQEDLTKFEATNSTHASFIVGKPT